MVNGDSNENGKKKKTINGSNFQKQKDLYMQHTFSYIALPLFCTAKT